MKTPVPCACSSWNHLSGVVSSVVMEFPVQKNDAWELREDLKGKERNHGGILLDDVE